MAKKITQDDMDIDEIRGRLTTQDKTLNEILIVLRGSISTDTHGLMQRVKEIKGQLDQVISDIAHLQRWKKMMDDNKGKLTITFTTLFTRVLAVIGALGSLVGIVLAIKELSEK